MSIELSHTITGLQKTAISVIDSGRSNAQRVAAKLGERIQGEPVPDLLGMQLSLAQLVEDDMNRLLRVDASHVSGVVSNRLKIEERDKAYAEAFGALSDVRSSVEGVYGTAARIDLFGGVTALPSDPLVMHRLGLRVHDQLLSEDFVLPQVKLAGWQPLDRQQLAAGLEQPLGRLGSILATLSLDRKGADGTLLDKTIGVEGFRRTVRFAGDCLASLYGLAGFDDLAAKVRPSRRARRRPNGDEPDAAGKEPNTGNESNTSGENVSEATDGEDPPAVTGPIGIVS